jgi:hypothetical protein
MSYCRHSNHSDVYVYQNLQWEFVCCGCKLTGKKKPAFKWYFALWIMYWVTVIQSLISIVTFTWLKPSWSLGMFFKWKWLINPNGPIEFATKTHQGMLAHLYKHKKAGHKVPKYATQRLRSEMRELGIGYKWD